MVTRTRSSAVGRLLQQWRSTRRVSQLTLAASAHVSPRHLSFIESGRSAPSRDMILVLATALDVPLRDRNQLLLAGGFAPVYRETPLADPLMAPVRDALERVLSHHEPYPAVVMDRHWNVLQANQPAKAMFAFLLTGAPAPDQPNVIRLMFGPLRPYVPNFAEVGPELIRRAHREAIAGVLDPQTDALLTEVLALPGIPASWRRPNFTHPILPHMPVRFARDAVAVSYFSMVTTVGTPQDVTCQEIRLESFFPVDDTSAEHRWS